MSGISDIRTLSIGSLPSRTSRMRDVLRGRVLSWLEALISVALHWAGYRETDHDDGEQLSLFDAVRRDATHAVWSSINPVTPGS
jgi:hypothetical protein